MEAEGLSLRFLCDIQILEIPFFQRSYVWDKDNWEELLDDLFTNKGNHFLGSIILKETKSKTSEADKAIIIDGQQRLTTLSLLIKALYDVVDNKDLKSNMFDDAKRALFYNLYSAGSDYHISIQHSHNDFKHFEEVIGKVEDGQIITNIKLDDINEESHKIERCYKYFYEELQKREISDIVELWNNLFTKKNKILVVIDLEDSDQEQEIFDTINSSGIKLSVTDIIKNNLYQRLIELTQDRETVSNYYKSTWEQVFEKDEDTLSYWNTEKTTGRFKKQNSELLLQAVSVITGIFSYDNKEHTFKKLSDLYKEHICKLSKTELESFINNILEYAKIYREHIFDFNGKENFVYNNDDLLEVEKRVAHILDKNEISTLNPYIIYIFHEYKEDNKKIIESLLDIEKLVMKYLITNKTVKNFNKDCALFINDKKGTAIKDKINGISNDDLSKGITGNITNKLGNIILFWIELHRHHPESKFDRLSLQDSYQLEHIMPQKWETNWSDVPYVDDDGTVLEPSEELKKRRYHKVYSLGNMTLLNGRLNASISNNNFINKMKGEGKYEDKGVIKYSSLSVTKDDIVETIYNKGDKVWNEKTIIDREKKLAKEVIELWG